MSEALYNLGDLVRKKRGSSWRGEVIAVYRNPPHTEIGYNVKSYLEPGNVQVYPEAALEPWDGGGRPTSEAEALAERLAREYRATMDKDVLDLWARDAVDLLRTQAARIVALEAERDRAKQERYLVWSNEHMAWWGKDRCGYTRFIERAGRYERPEALSIAGTRDGGWHVRKGNPDEIALPEQDAIDQYASITDEQLRAALDANGAGEVG